MPRQHGFSLISLTLIFAIIAALIWFVAKVVAPPLIKKEIEARATQEWGAEVNVRKVSLSLYPLGATVYGIQLTDHEKPAENLIVIDAAFADPDVIATLKTDMKPILERVDIRGVQMHQPRRTPGKVYRKPEPIVPPDLKRQTQAVVAKGLPEFKMPDPQRILKEEKLETLAVAQRLKQRVAQLKRQWNESRQKLPDEQSLKRLQEQLAQLQKQELDPQALARLQKLQSDIEAERKKLDAASEFFAEVESVRKQLAQLEALPAKDLQRLRQRYTFDAKGAAHLVETLLGAEIQPYVAVAQRWLTALRQLSAPKRKEKPAQPSPARDVLVRRLTIDGRLPSGRFDAEASGVTLNQAFYDVITPYRMRYYPARADKPIVIKGKADLQNPELAQIQALLEGVGIQLQDLALFEYPTLSLALKRAAAHIAGRADVISWEKIEGDLNARFKDVAWAILKTQDRDVQRYLTPVLERIKDFDIRIGFSGSLYAPKLTIRTDLDKALGASLEKLMYSELKKAERQLADELRKRVKAKVAEISPELAPLLSEKTRLDDLKANLQSLLKQRLQQELPAKKLEEDAQKRLEEKAREELLKRLPGGLKLPGF